MALFAALRHLVGPGTRTLPAAAVLSLVAVLPAPVAPAAPVASVALVAPAVSAVSARIPGRPGWTGTGIPLALAAALGCERLRTLVCTHGADSAQEMTAASAGAGDGGAGSASGSGASTALGCYGDGTSGMRVRAVYARPVGSPDRYAATAASFRSWAGRVDHVFDASAVQTRGHRHVRFATSGGRSCVLDVIRITLPGSAFATFLDTVQALQDAGLQQSSSKYLVWADAQQYCGIASTFADDTAALTNANNGGAPSYARIDRPCWGYAEAHELVHMLGGVQVSAPHATAGYHCNDAAEVMCYADGSARSTQRAVCGSSNAGLLDCNHDDYFSTAAPRGSYLQTHWNVARSSFLAAGTSDPAPAAGPRTAAPSSDPSPTGSPSAGAAPTPSSTAEAPTPAPELPGLTLPPVPSLPPSPGGAPGPSGDARRISSSPSLRTGPGWLR